jgi:hypothetical protein
MSRRRLPTFQIFCETKKVKFRIPGKWNKRNTFVCSAADDIEAHPPHTITSTLSLLHKKNIHTPSSHSSRFQIN